MFWYVESWNGLNRYSKTGDMNFTLGDAKRMSFLRKQESSTFYGSLLSQERSLDSRSPPPRGKFTPAKAGAGVTMPFLSSLLMK
jgi:hypothetical protein